MTNAELDDALTLLRDYRLLEYVRVIMVTLFFYDYLVSLKHEISSIWAGKWTTLNVLYLLTRYIPFFNFTYIMLTFFADLGPKLCMPLFQLSMWTSMVGIGIAEACFCLRAYALWGASRGVGVFLGVLFATTMVAGSILNVFVSASATTIQPMIDAPRITPHCMIRFNAGTLTICGWIFVMVLDTILILMIVYAKCRMYRAFIVTENDLLDLIYRDAILCFLCSLVISTTAVILYFISPGPVRSAASMLAVTLFSILSCKVMLRLRDFGNNHPTSQDISTVDASMTLSSLRFNRDTDVHMSIPEECP